MMMSRLGALSLVLAATVATTLTAGTRVTIFAMAAATCGFLWLLVAPAGGGRRATGARLFACALALTAFATFADRPMTAGDSGTVYPSFGAPAAWITQAQFDHQPGVTELAYIASPEDNPTEAVSVGWLVFDVAAFALLLGVVSHVVSSKAAGKVDGRGSLPANHGAERAFDR